MICYYHRDPDGFASGAIIKRFYPECECISINYGEDVDWDKVKDQEVYMVDFSLPIDDMDKLNKTASKFIWIDHHQSAIKDYDASEVEIEGLRKIGDAGCECTWNYVAEFENRKSDMPLAIELIGNFDVFRDAERDKPFWDGEVMPFLYGFQTYPTEETEPGGSFWIECFKVEEGTSIDAIEGFYNKVIDKGETVLNYTRASNASLVTRQAFDLKWEGFTFCAMNRQGNSLMFDSGFDPNKHDAMLPFFLTNDGKWSCSIYAPPSSTHDFSIIAKKHGGGGHKRACGFQLDKLPFKLSEVK